MLHIAAAQVSKLLPYEALIKEIAAAFRDEVETPNRAHLEVAVPGAAQGNLLIMPAWRCGDMLGIKIATIFPDNATRGLPAVYANYLALDGATGQPLALLDGTELTLRRTAATSAMAADALCRQSTRRLLIVGTGKLVPHLIAAHNAVRKYTDIKVWGRRHEAASDVAEKATQNGYPTRATADLESAVRQADLISCATLSKQPLVRGDWLQAGQHLDLVGAFRPDMSEADEKAMGMGRLYVDTYAGALSEAGDIIRAIESGHLREQDIIADLSELCGGRRQGRLSDDTITIFKSVGCAVEDWAAAKLALRRMECGGSDQFDPQ